MMPWGEFASDIQAPRLHRAALSHSSYIHFFNIDQDSPGLLHVTRHSVLGLLFPAVLGPLP